MRDQFEVNPINHHPISLQQSHPDVELFSQSINPSMIKISWSLRSFQNQSINPFAKSILPTTIRCLESSWSNNPWRCWSQRCLSAAAFSRKKSWKIERERELAQSKTFQSIPNERLSYQQSISQSPISWKPILLLTWETNAAKNKSCSKRRDAQTNKQKLLPKSWVQVKITSCFKPKNVQTLPEPEPNCPVKHLAGREFVLICD